MKTGLEVLLSDKKSLKSLKGRKVGLVCHPASVDVRLQHSFDLLQKSVGLSCAFGPQHGVKGEKQDNMIESADYVDPVAKIPIFSLYGKVRRPTAEMLSHCDVVVFDLQDLGCRIYTFVTTLLYVMEECAKRKKSLVVLDRPNPAGRAIEGFMLQPGWESFVGAAPMPMRHGLTVAELALYYRAHFNLNLDLQIIKMQGYKPTSAGFGWPETQTWVNPSPNAQTVNMARVYPGTVMIEGTTLSEGRGTTRALEVVGAANMDFNRILKEMNSLDQKGAKSWLKGMILRECYFQPTFHKFSGELCHGFQMHTDFQGFKYTAAKPYRTIALMLKCIRRLYPDFQIYRDFAYEYVENKLAFDVINGGPRLREWIEDKNSTAADLDAAMIPEEKSWQVDSRKYLLY